MSRMVKANFVEMNENTMPIICIGITEIGKLNETAG